MADPISAIGLAASIIGLVPICADGFTFIEGICKAQGGLGNQVIRIRGQQAVSLDPNISDPAWQMLMYSSQILRGWGKTWDVPLEQNEPKQPNHSKKLQKWIDEDPRRGNDVQETLYAISDIFTDTNNLERKYGVVITQKDANLRKLNIEELLGGRINRNIEEQDVQAIRNHMNIVMRCHFKLRGEQKLAELVERLKEFVENLLKMCSEVQAQRIENAILKQFSHSDNPDDLISISRVYEQEVEDRKRAGQRYQGYELIKEVFDFKARVQHLARKRAKEMAKRKASGRSTVFLFSRPFLDIKEFRYDAPQSVESSTPFFDIKEIRYDAPQSVERNLETILTLATVDKLDALRYVEWKSYADSTLGSRKANSDHESHIIELADFLAVQNRPAAFQVLPCLGIFRDEEHLRFGFAFEPPPYIGNLGPNKGLGRDSGLWSRTPVTLYDLISQGTIFGGMGGILPLGDRFHMARKLAQTLYVMHAMGWVYKNIRPTSVIFVPAESSYGGIPSTTGAKDLANPYLGGFGYSRPERPNQRPTYFGTSGILARQYITLDRYHHPSKFCYPSLRYIQAFDLYSLGLVLLEIGLWKSLFAFEIEYKSKDAFGFREYLINRAMQELPGRMGNIYAEAVKECLVSSAKDTDPYTQDRLCWKVNAALDQCVA